MRLTAKVLAAAALTVATCWSSASQATFFSYPQALGTQVNRTIVEKPALPPMAHTMFCLRYKKD
jgi:hypothetical protein